MTAPIDYDALLDTATAQLSDAAMDHSARLTMLHMFDAIRALRAAAVESELDAGRYRDLRRNAPISDGRPFVAILSDGRLSVWAEAMADDVVDRSMAAQEKANG